MGATAQRRKGAPSEPSCGGGGRVAGYGTAIGMGQFGK